MSDVNETILTEIKSEENCSTPPSSSSPADSASDQQPPLAATSQPQNPVTTPEHVEGVPTELDSRSPEQEPKVEVSNQPCLQSAPMTSTNGEVLKPKEAGGNQSCVQSAPKCADLEPKEARNNQSCLQPAPTSCVNGEGLKTKEAGGNQPRFQPTPKSIEDFKPKEAGNNQPCLQPALKSKEDIKPKEASNNQPCIQPAPKSIEELKPKEAGNSQSCLQPAPKIVEGIKPKEASGNLTCIQPDVKPVVVEKKIDEPPSAKNVDEHLSFMPQRDRWGAIYFGGIGRLVGSALTCGLFVDEKLRNLAVYADDGSATSTTATESKYFIDAKNKSQNLKSEFLELQALLDAMPKFTCESGRRNVQLPCPIFTIKPEINTNIDKAHYGNVLDSGHLGTGHLDIDELVDNSLKLF